MKLILLFLSLCFFSCQSAQTASRVLNSIPKTSFTCEGKGNGYFADIEAGCQSYHLCDDGGRQYTYLCPNQTLFNQRMLICDHWYQVECSISTEFYSKNDLIGNQALHFLNLEDSSRPKKKAPEDKSFPDHLAASSIAASQVGGNFRTGPAKSVREFEPTPSLKTTEPQTKTASTTPAPETTVKTPETTVKTTIKPKTAVPKTESTDLVTDTTFAVETTTVSPPVELHTNGEQLTTIVQEERISLSKLLSPSKAKKVEETLKSDETFESDESEEESEEDSSEVPKSLFDTEPLGRLIPGTLEHEIVSIAISHGNEQLTTLGFTADEPAHAHDEFLPLFDMRRMFFIPADDHTMPPEKEIINVKLNTIDEGPTMKFNEKKFFVKSGRTLDPNPQCPFCHPHFLQPGQCIPCVIIR